MASKNKPETKEQKRKTLRLLGSAWVTPTVLSATIPAHAQTTGAFCGGMVGVAGYWGFKFDDLLHGLYLYPNGSVVDGTGFTAKWSLNGSEIRVYDFEDRPNSVYLGEIDSSCKQALGEALPRGEAFIATKINDSLP